MTTATGVIDRRDVSRIPGPLVGLVEFLRMMSKKPVGLIGLIGVLFFLTHIGLWILSMRSATLAALEEDHVTVARDRKSTRLNSSHPQLSRMPSSA